MPSVGLQCVIVVFPDHAHLLFAYLTIGMEYSNMSQTKFDTMINCLEQITDEIWVILKVGRY